jgi:hypothetical protein
MNDSPERWRRTEAGKGMACVLATRMIEDVCAVSNTLVSQDEKGSMTDLLSDEAVFGVYELERQKTLLALVERVRVFLYPEEMQADRAGCHFGPMAPISNALSADLDVGTCCD